MRSLTAALAPFAILVGCAPAEPEGALPRVEPSEVDALLLEAGQVPLGTIERCNNNKDDDGDGLKDGADPDCKGGGKGPLGLAGDVFEGTGILPSPEMTVLRTPDAELGVQYSARGTDGLDKEYSLLSLKVTEGRESFASYVTVYGGEVVAVTPVLLEGDREPSLVIDVEIDREIVSYLAYGPLGNNVYTDQGALPSAKR